MWSDGEVQEIEKSLTRVAPDPGTRFQHKQTGKWFELVAYGDGEKEKRPKNDKGHGCILFSQGQSSSTTAPEGQTSSTTAPDTDPNPLCTQCGHPTSNMHACPCCKKVYHDICMLSFNDGSKKVCANCFSTGANAAERQHWKPDKHLHDPYGHGSVPYSPFTREYFNKKRKSPPQKQQKQKRLKRTQWKRCRAPALHANMTRRLNKWFRDKCAGERPARGIYTIYQRLVKKYVATGRTTYVAKLVDVQLKKVGRFKNVIISKKLCVYLRYKTCVLAILTSVYLRIVGRCRNADNQGVYVC